MQQTDSYFEIDTELGQTFIAYNDKGVSACSMAKNGKEFEKWFSNHFGRTAKLGNPPAQLRKDIEEWKKTGDASQISFDLSGITPFSEKVLRQILKIHSGEVRSYSWVAAGIGHPKAVRAVGSALNRNPVPLLIPCHRVVKSDGTIGKFAWGTEAKRRLLELEDVPAYRAS